MPDHLPALPVVLPLAELLQLRPKPRQLLM